MLRSRREPPGCSSQQAYRKRPRNDESGRLCYNFPARNKSVAAMNQTRRYFVSGFVQGVGFRIFTLHAGEKLRITGCVRNVSDGRVEVLATGTPEQLADLRGILEKGPRFSSVSEVREESAEPDPEYTSGFVIAPGD